MLRPDVVVTQLERLAEGAFQHPLRARRERNLTGGWRSLSQGWRSLSQGLAVPLRGRPAARPAPRPRSSVTSSDTSARAAAPSSSRKSPSRRCSEPTWLWRNSRASSCASATTKRARSVNCSNTPKASHQQGGHQTAVQIATSRRARTLSDRRPDLGEAAGSFRAYGRGRCGAGRSPRRRGSPRG